MQMERARESCARAASANACAARGKRPDRPLAADPGLAGGAGPDGMCCMTPPCSLYGPGFGPGKYTAASQEVTVAAAAAEPCRCWSSEQSSRTTRGIMMHRLAGCAAFCGGMDCSESERLDSSRMRTMRYSKSKSENGFVKLYEKRNKFIRKKELTSPPIVSWFPYAAPCSSTRQQQQGQQKCQDRP
jgi:hypothetical protein